MRKDIVVGSNLFQLIGANGASDTSARGFVLFSTLAQNSSITNQVSATTTGHVMFSDGDGTKNPPHPAYATTDCRFEGTPVDGTYVAATDTLYVVATGVQKASLVAIIHATVPAQRACQVMGSLTNPSLVTAYHNASLSKMAYDSNRGVIYGAINQGPGLTSQFFAYDVFSQNLVTRDISSTITTYEVIFSQALNAVYLFDNVKSGSTRAPTLYKIW